MKPDKALEHILNLAAKHEVQYWLDATGTDAEKLRKIVTICRDALHEIREANEPPSVRLISMRDIEGPDGPNCRDRIVNAQ